MQIVGRAIHSDTEVARKQQKKKKPIILGVTGTSDEVKDAYFMVNSEIKAKRLDLWMEINLSCPNIKG